MPIYEYKCNDCHRVLEKRQKFSDPELTECPHCGGHLEKQFSAPSFQFAGGGWYADGYGNKSPSKSDGSSDSASSTGSSDSGSSSSSSDSSSASPASVTPSAPASTPAVSTPASTSTTK